MYVAHENSTISRPKEELKGFKRISLAKGKRRTVMFHLTASELAYWDEPKGDWKVESDRVRIRVGASSSDIREEAVLTLQ
jgi:beta-glucosidase